MGDQQMYKTNHTIHGNENLYYQQPPHSALSGGNGINHSYGGTASAGGSMEASQASPLSPHFPQDSRDNLGLAAGPKNLGLMDSSRQTGWGGHAGPNNHIQLRGSLSNPNMMWGASAQVEPAEAYSYAYPQSSDIRAQKITSGVLHKLDSFTQVFANQNLRIQVNNMAQVLHSQSSVDGPSDSALRQLLSQKPSEPQAVAAPPAVPPRYQQMPHQTHSAFANGPPKPAMQGGQHPSQAHLYYDYPQQMAQMPAQGSQPLQGQQMLPQPMPPMQQAHYYLQQPPSGQQRMPMPDMQQQQPPPPPPQQQPQSRAQQLLPPAPQRPCSIQLPHYYPTQPMMPQLQQQQQQQQPPPQQMQLQPPSYHRDAGPKSVHEPHQYSQEQGPHPVQLIQLGSMPQYFYQDPQPQYSRHFYQQSLLQQQQQQQQQQHRENVQLKNYQSDRQAQTMLGTHGGLGLPEPGMEDMNSAGNSLTHRPLLPQAGLHLNSKGPQHQQLSPGSMWSQMHLSDGRGQPLSPDPSAQPTGVFGEQLDAKNKLTCSICFKEFKSLPALNGHMRSHGGMRSSPSFKQEEGEKALQLQPPPPPQQQPPPPPPPLPPQSQLPPEVENPLPIVMPVSVPVKLLSPEPSPQVISNSITAARDKPASSMSDDEMPVLVRMTLSPPNSPKVAAPCAPSEIPRKHQPGMARTEEHFKPTQDKKKYRHRPEPLFIPPPSFNLNTTSSYTAATLYQSQLRSPRILGDHLLDPAHELPPYTPPPMLSPVRQGSGLFSNVISTSSHGGPHPQLPLTPLTPTPRVLLCRSNSIDGGNSALTPGLGEQSLDIEPRINIGVRFQAEIPELQDVSSLSKDTHKATLVWKPWPELENQEFQKRVENLLNLCCSSALPGGGTNSEFALHSLFEAKGDIMAALEMLLLKKPIRFKCHPLANYHYAGSDKWTSLERKLFNKALATYSKDFIFVQKMVKSKTVAQCVEYYYTWKKIMRLGRKHRTRLAEIIDECATSEEEEDIEDDDDLEEDRKSTKEDDPDVQKSPDPPPISLVAPADLPALQSLTPSSVSFVCEMPNCGAVFSSRQALNGHARIHGGTNQVAKARCSVPPAKQKQGAQSGYCSVKSSPAHSTASGETDPTTVFPCKECGKVFFKIKSRNAHMKTHRQQEEQQRQKAQKAAVAAEMAAAIERTTGPVGPGLIPLDHLGLIKHVEDVDILGDDVVQELGGVIEETEVVDTDLLLDDDTTLLQGDTEL